MNTTELREDLHKRIDDMDERLLKAIHTILHLQEDMQFFKNLVTKNASFDGC